MRKLTIYALPIITLLAFIIIMNSGDYLKKPFSQHDNVPRQIVTLEKEIKQKDWQQASQEWEKLDSAWEKVMPRIQFSVEKDEINAIDVGLGRLKGYIVARDYSNALAQLSEIREHWENLNE